MKGLMIKDYSRINLHPDYVVCNHCGALMFVDGDVDVCPSCGKEGALMDIKQEVDPDDYTNVEVVES